MCRTWAVTSAGRCGARIARRLDVEVALLLCQWSRYAPASVSRPAARRVFSYEIDCPPIDPTPSLSELAILSRLLWRTSVIAPTELTVAGMRTGNKTFSARQIVSFREASRGEFARARGIRMKGLAEQDRRECGRRSSQFPTYFCHFPTQGIVPRTQNIGRHHLDRHANTGLGRIPRHAPRPHS